MVRRICSRMIRRLGRIEFGQYRPERYYMRGAGPACRRREMTRLG